MQDMHAALCAWAYMIRGKHAATQSHIKYTYLSLTSHSILTYSYHSAKSYEIYVGELSIMYTYKKDLDVGHAMLARRVTHAYYAIG